jgi:hypothetical protein
MSFVNQLSFSAKARGNHVRRQAQWQGTRLTFHNRRWTGALQMFLGRLSMTSRFRARRADLLMEVDGSPGRPGGESSDYHKVNAGWRF